MPILAQEIRRLRSKIVSFRKTDSKGLYLEVFPNGSKLWRYKFRIAGREKRMALGAWPEISLADARKRRDLARLKVLDGIDPTLERKRKKRLARMNAGNSFRSVAEDFIKVRMEDSGKAESTFRKARWYVLLLEPDFGRRLTNDIEPVEVLEALKKIERKGHRESANRTCALASRVFRHPDTIERALAQGDSNAIRGIYNRGNYRDERVQMAQWRSDYLDDLKAGAKVLPFRRAALSGSST